MAESAFRVVWLLVMFDLPTLTPEERSAYREFRLRLIDQGFSMLQFSVYGKSCASEDAARVVRAGVQGALPSGGEVRVLSVTDHQFQAMATYVRGKKSRKPAGPTSQLLLF